MPKDNSKGPLLRNTYILLSIIALLGAFIALNYLVFIPRQQSEFNKKAFRIMHEEADDFKQRIKGYADFFQKTQDESKIFKGDDSKWSDYRLDSASAAGKHIRGVITVDALSKPVNDMCTIEFVADSVIFRYTKKAGDTGSDKPKVLPKSLDEIIKPIQAMHQQTFEYILLIGKDADSSKAGKTSAEKLIYKSPDLAIDNSIYIDSLLKKGAFLFATIHDMDVEGAKYKVFVLPFSINNQYFYLAGFIEDQGYKLSVTSSSSWAYSLIIVLLLSIIINLPTLKLFLLGKQENIVITDVRMLMVSLTVAPVFFIMALLIVKAYNISDNISTRIMLDLHSQIKKTFSRELDSMVQQLKEYDASIDSSKFSLDDATITPPTDAFFYPRTYKMLINLNWVEAGGWQIGKWSFGNDGKFSFLEVSSRKYFRAIRDGKAFVMGKDSIYIQPTLSWSSGEYSVNVAIPSHQEFDVGNAKKNAILISLSSIMYSTYNPVLPRPYSFAIIDKKGEVLFHSQSDRALHENLFDETNNNQEVINAVRHNDSVFIPSVSIYDNDVKMLITPIKGLPLYLAGFYNKREQNYFVYHISAFSFLCISVVLILLLFFLYLYYLAGRKVSPLLFSPGESDWMKPAARKEVYYKKLVVFFALLIALIVLVSIVIFEFCNAHWLILDIAVLSCFLSVTGYYIIKKGVPINRRAENTGLRKLLYPHRKILLFFTFILFVISLVIMFYTKSLWWLVIPWVFSLMVIAAVFKIGGMANFRFMEKDYLQHYVWAIFLSIVLISVLPTFIFFKYALDHEKFLQVKSRQIYLAERIVQRGSFIDSVFRLSKISKYHRQEDSIFINNVKYQMGYGIYSAFSSVQDTVTPALPKPPSSVDSFYKVVTQFLFLPSDHSDFFNNTPYYGWSDKSSNNTVRFYYKKDINSNNNNALLIETSLLGLDFSLISDLFKSFLGWVLLSILVAALIVHFRVIKALARRVFLNEFPGIDITDHTDKLWIDRHVNLKTVAEHDMDFLQEVERLHHRRKQEEAGEEEAEAANANGDKLLKHEKFTISHSLIYGYESEEMVKSNYANILRMQAVLAPTYDDIWKELSEKEKFILYDFALDGFTNYKNPDTLYGLFKKGLLRQDRENGGLILMTYSFRNYLISKSDTPEIERLRRIVNRGGTWKLIQNIFFVTLMMVFAYLIITRQDVSTKIAAIISGLVSLVPALIKLFDRKTADSEKS